MIGDHLRNLRFAARRLARTPGFSVAAILVLALGLCAGVSLFTFVDAALIRPLPYANPSRLVAIFGSVPVTCPRCRISYLDFLDLKRLTRVYSALDAYKNTQFIVHTDGRQAPVAGARVSAGFFKTLGVGAAVGRDFTENEDRPGAAPAVVLSDAVWQTRYGGRADVLGQTLTLDDASYVIVGVLPHGFHFAPIGPADYWTTLDPTTYCEQRRGCHDLSGLARLNDGVSAAAAAADTALIARSLEERYPESNRNQGESVVPLTDAILGDVRPVLLALLGGAGLLLLIGAVNITSLLMIRSDSRRRDTTVRSALGASRSALIEPFLSEGVLLVAAACGLGLVSAQWTMRVLDGLIPVDMMRGLPFLQGLALNSHSAVFTAFIAALAAVLFGVAPTLYLPAAVSQADLREGTGGSARNTWRRLGSKLVVLEIATAAVLLVGAGLLGQSVYRLLHVDFGFEPRNLTALTVTVQESGIRTSRQVAALARQIVDTVSALPGVQAVGHTSSLPVTANGNSEWIRVASHPFHGEHDEVNERRVSAGYFPALGAALWRGRLFTDEETALGSPGVTIINKTLATRYFHDEDPIGKQIGDLELSPASMRTIVGVVNDIREGPLDADVWPAEYRPFNQRPAATFSLVVRSFAVGPPVLSAVAAALRSLDRGLIITGETTVQDEISESPSAYMHRSLAFVFGGFAAIALLLSTIGLYGVVAYSVGQRTREIGIRMALGAERRAMYSLVLVQAGWLAAIGIGVGLACALAVTAFMRALLFGVESWSPATLGMVAAVLAGAALAASYIPARRAASIDPVEALRAE